MKKNSAFVMIVLGAALTAAILIYMLILGNADNFKDAARHQPKNILGIIHTGGIVVPILITITLMVFTYIVERYLSLAKAKGKRDVHQFLAAVEGHLEGGNIDAAIDTCNQQRGTVANIIRAGLEQFKKVRNDDRLLAEQKLSEVKRVMEEAQSIETPLLERNLVGLSTIASIATMVGLLGTTVGMITAFKALGEQQGAASATQLSLGIAEALINTALGIFAAIVAIIFYNVFTNKVDSFTYEIDEASLNLVDTLNIRYLGGKASA